MSLEFSKPDSQGISRAEIPFVWVLIPFIAGILAVYYLNVTSLLLVAAICCLLSLSYLCLANIFYVILTVYRFKGIIVIVLCFFWFSLGALSCILNRQDFNKNHFSKISHDHLLVRIDNEPQYKKKIVKLNVSGIKAFKGSEIHTVSGRLMLTVLIDTLNPIRLN